MAKPSVLPIWDTNDTNTTEPPASRKADGWLIVASVPEKPPVENFNFWQRNTYLWLKELNDFGMLEWDALTTYEIDSYVRGSDGLLYRGLTAANLNNDPVGDVVNWQDVAAASGIIGEIKSWPLGSPPLGTLECDGSAVSRTTYASLFAILSTAYGIGDGATTFNLPDYRGEFLRGFDHGAGNDPDAAGRTDRGDGTVGDNAGTKEADAMQGHWHQDYYLGVDGAGGGVGDRKTTRNATSEANAATAKNIREAITDGVNGTPRITSETRPRNVNVMYVIKY